MRSVFAVLAIDDVEVQSFLGRRTGGMVMKSGCLTVIHGAIDKSKREWPNEACVLRILD